MRRIVIKVPQKEKEKWMLGFGARPRSMARADTLYNRLERLLLRTKVNEKTAIIVKEDREVVNESLSSIDSKYLLYVAGCFLEDYLSKEVINRVEKQYGKIA